MSIRVALTHRTRYDYDRPVILSPQLVRLRPAPHSRTAVLSYALKIGPAKHFINWQQDPQGNYVARLVFPDKVESFTVDVDLIAEIQVFNPFDFFLEPDAEKFPFAYDPVLATELAPFLKTDAMGPRLAAWVAAIDRRPRSTADFVVDLNARLQSEIRYLIRMEPGVQTPEETLERRSGSCRDSAWLLVQILRQLGLAARFVSGYLIQLVADQKPLEGPAGPTEDFTDLHAWAEVYLPGAGWIGLDATSGLLTGEGHIPLACTPDPASAAPIAGAVELCQVSFDHRMEVARLVETPRVTKPYSVEQWQAVDRLGQQVDARLTDGDVRLTMGGEPTFVAIEDVEAPEWNTEAVGPTKRERAHDLIMRLRDIFAPDGLLTFGQGKWYPGEPLPRWAFSLTWRGDGQPFWSATELVAPERAGDSPDEETARLFGERLAERLGLGAEYLLPAYEDPVQFALREQQLPVNVDPFDSKLEDPEERARLLRVFRHGLARPVGFVLPIQLWQGRDGPRWISGPWTLRRERLYLATGDSPIGFRLPLDSLSYIAPADYPYFTPLDPFAPRGPLPVRGQTAIATPPPTQAAIVTEQPAPRGSQQQQVGGQRLHPRADGAGHMVSDNIRTALCLEPRDGRLSIFLPPIETADAFTAMVHAIEEVAAELSQPVAIEGYPPPADHRLHSIKVTPDPGVIEVNIHPADSWPMLRDSTLALYHAAREARLASEKFMIDGRHIGTGGGNHIVLGGVSAADSPFLRRPDLLGSLVRFWQNHPALSYLFSGLFIGPTSQAPRVDEARDDSLYELEIALRQLPGRDGAAPPWLVDRVLRNLLTDVTGNTHRSEICIDKLYSPDGPTGRLGLVELRGFEMPPHAEMSLVTQLLVRALVARFWHDPYQQPLVRWGQALRDRFMLPHYIAADFRDVLADLAAHGLAFDEGWFAPHMEFRFPLLGRVAYDAVSIELRHALEPWHVMGEEQGGGGTVRYVDSSVERLQVKVSGLTAGRHVVTCNGRAVPLVATGTPGEAVAGVRFRAWQPPHCLHPTIKVQAPLRFDLVDGWNHRSLGGCSYHVAHPGGRNFETFPVNANEAEGRRLARFEPFGQAVGPLAPPPVEINPQFPTTLDLRWEQG